MVGLLVVLGIKLGDSRHKACSPQLSSFSLSASLLLGREGDVAGDDFTFLFLQISEGGKISRAHGLAGLIQ